MGSGTLCVAFALDVSKSMDDDLEFLGKKIEVAKRFLLRISSFLLKAAGRYKLHLYLFPSPIPELMPHEKMHQGLVVDHYSIAKLERLLSQVTDTRPTTPLIEALELIAKEVESRCTIVAITDGEIAHPAFSSGRVSALARVLEEKDMKAMIVVLSMSPSFLEALASVARRVHLEVLRPSLLHSGVMDDTARLISAKVVSLASGEA